MTELFVARRFNGPARSGNGGYTAGALASFVDAPLVEVSLRQPPPLGTAMPVTEADGTTVASYDGHVVAEARGVVDLALEDLPSVPPDVAARSMLRYAGLSGHPFPTCFACGPDRAEGDGLRIFPGPVGDDPGVVASLWVPHESDVATTWAALDCVGGWSSDLEGRPSVLGRMTARLESLPVVGEPHVVVGRHLGDEGRKTFTASALHDADGRLVAEAVHVWLQVDPSLFN
jgi:hypothetical protein